jgi:ASC-1-like (ASCH) protein
MFIIISGSGHMKIEKKIWPEYFEKIKSGKKTFELRLADWKCNVGDVLLLKEWNPKTKEYTGREIEKEVTYVLKTKNVKLWTQDDIEKYGFQIISIK